MDFPPDLTPLLPKFREVCARAGESESLADRAVEAIWRCWEGGQVYFSHVTPDGRFPPRILEGFRALHDAVVRELGCDEYDLAREMARIVWQEMAKQQVYFPRLPRELSDRDEQIYQALGRVPVRTVARRFNLTEARVRQIHRARLKKARHPKPGPEGPARGEAA